MAMTDGGWRCMTSLVGSHGGTHGGSKLGSGDKGKEIQEFQ